MNMLVINYEYAGSVHSMKFSQTAILGKAEHCIDGCNSVNAKNLFFLKNSLMDRDLHPEILCFYSPFGYPHKINMTSVSQV